MNKEFIENILLESFKKEPFHNLYFKYNVIPNSFKFGGTCSDKVLSIYTTLKKQNINVTLHSSFINDIESHRLLKIYIDGIYYFADVGNAWPSIKMFPISHDYEYTAYGIKFRSVVLKEHMEIYQLKNNKETFSLKIPFFCRSEELIKRDIENRFSKDIDYPFKNNIRFAQVINEKFYFLRNDILYIYSNNEMNSENIYNLNERNLEQILQKFFNFNLKEFNRIGNIND